MVPQPHAAHAHGGAQWPFRDALSRWYFGDDLAQSKQTHDGQPLGSFDPSSNEWDQLAFERVEQFQICCLLGKLPQELERLDDDTYYDLVEVNRVRREALMSRVRSAIEGSIAHKSGAESAICGIIQAISELAIF